MLHVQAHAANDLAVRWNCKAAKCGSCSAEVCGMPKLMCKTRLEECDLSKPILVQPLQRSASSMPIKIRFGVFFENLPALSRNQTHLAWPSIIKSA